MNILFISSQPFPYGMAGSKRIRLFAEYLAINNNVKVIVAGDNNDRNVNEGKEKKVSFEFIKFSRLQIVIDFIKVTKILKANFRNNDKNVIFLYDGIGLTNFLFAIIGRKMGYKIITDIIEDHGIHKENTGFFLSILYKINIIFERQTNNFADGVIVISSRLKSKLNKLGVSDNMLEIIPISAENIDLEIKYKIVQSDYFTFVYSGSYGNKDGLEILIEAFKELLKVKTEIRLLLAGKMTKKISDLIVDEPAINYVGMIPDDEYYQFLSNADVLLMTRVNSEYANTGFPFKLGEYLATGKPVIATRVSDIEIYLKNSQDIVLAEPSDLNSLLSAFKFVVTHKHEILKIGQNGKQKCKLFFNPKLNGKKLEDFLNRIS